jgi:DNA-binding transcriptional LysR family regulator
MLPLVCVLNCVICPTPALTELLAGEVDLALGFSTSEDIRHPELEEIGWFEDEYVVISNASRTRLTLEDYLAARHLVVTPWNEKQGFWICGLNSWAIPGT